MKNDEALARQGAGGLSTIDDTFAPMEGFDADSKDGKEGINPGDWKPAFLSIAQMTSKAKDETDDKYIEGLKLGDMYVGETREVFGRGPVEVQLLRHRKSAYLPDENGRKGEEIPWDDPRCEWPTEEQKKNWKGKGKPKPQGVRVYDWVALLLGRGAAQLIVISFKSKSFGAGQTITKFAGMVQGPVYTAKFAITSQLTENEAGKFGVFAVQAAGKPTREQADYAKAIYESTKGKAIPDASDDHDADETVEGEVVPTTPLKTNADIPF